MNSIKKFKSEADYYAKINRECTGEDLLIETCDGDTLYCEFISLDIDNLTIGNEDTSTESYPTASIKKITYTSNTVGFFQGLGIGLVGGASTLAILGSAFELGGAMIAYYYLSPAILIGATVIGAESGSDNIFIINECEIENARNKHNSNQTFMPF
jgi:hypothetical protein